MRFAPSRIMAATVKIVFIEAMNIYILIRIRFLLTLLCEQARSVPRGAMIMVRRGQAFTSLLRRKKRSAFLFSYGKVEIPPDRPEDTEDEGDMTPSVVNEYSSFPPPSLPSLSEESNYRH